MGHSRKSLLDGNEVNGGQETVEIIEFINKMKKKNHQAFTGCLQGQFSERRGKYLIPFILAADARQRLSNNILFPVVAKRIDISSF